MFKTDTNQILDIIKKYQTVKQLISVRKTLGSLVGEYLALSGLVSRYEGSATVQRHTVRISWVVRHGNQECG